MVTATGVGTAMGTGTGTDTGSCRPVLGPGPFGRTQDRPGDRSVHRPW